MTKHTKYTRRSNKNQNTIPTTQRVSRHTTQTTAQEKIHHEKRKKGGNTTKVIIKNSSENMD